MKPTLPIAMIGLALVSLLGYRSIYVPAQERIHVIQADIAQEQLTQQAQAEVAAMLKQVEQLRKPLAPDPDPSWLVRQAVELAKETGIQFASITQDPPERLQFFTRLTTTLQFTASYHQLGAFLDRVERAPNFLRVERLTVTPPAERDGPSPVQLVLGTLYVPPVDRMLRSR